MKKHILLNIFILFFLSLNLLKALPDQAIDFTATDINGNSHVLFDYLNDDKYVLLFFFNNDCNVCETDIPVINNIYTYFGCNSSELIVLGIDNISDNTSINQYRQDFNVLYPLISGLNGSGFEIDSLYEIINYPSYVFIKPDKSVVEISASVSQIKEYGVLKNECEGTQPKAFFEANQNLIMVGESVNFTDLSKGEPWYWEWTFWGATPESSNIQHPQGITYNTVGTYDVQMLVLNNYGYDTVIRKEYIQVIDDIGDEAPIAKFTANNRLIKVGNYVSFIDQSENYPTYWMWNFQGGEPHISYSQNLPGGVRYDTVGYFDVSLVVYNTIGQSFLKKNDYVVVYHSYISQICDSVSNLKKGEVPVALQSSGITGYIGGHNSERIRAYADYYNFHTYNEIHGVIIPIITKQNSNPNAYIDIVVWDGEDKLPSNEIYSQRVLYRDLQENFVQTILFDKSVEIEGPFYIGYTLNYGAGQEFVIGMAPNRGANGYNSVFVKKDDNWHNLKNKYEIATSTAIKPIVCIVGIDELYVNDFFDIYPNPVKDIINIKYEKFFNEGEFIELYDYTGKILLQKFPKPNTNQIYLNLSQIPNGMYFLRIFAQGMLFVEKISVMR